MIVPIRPYKILPRPFKVLGKKERYYGLPGKNVSFFKMGRDAIYSACSALGLKPGDGIIVPAFICSSAVDPLVSYGLKVNYIDVETGVRFSFDKIREMLKDGSKAVFMTHYFGFPSDLIEALRGYKDKKPLIIEDCCHAFLGGYNDKPLGSFGDAAVLSVRKFAPVPHGGALVLSDESKRFPKTGKINSLEVAASYLIKNFIERMNYSLEIINPYGENYQKIKSFLTEKKGVADIASGKRYGEGADGPFYMLSSLLGNEDVLNNIKDCRRRNYIKMAAIMTENGVPPLWENLPDGVVPMALPFVDETGELCEWLRTNGVGVYNWPKVELPKNVSEEQYPNAVMYARKTMLLPVHQDISEKHLGRISYLLKAWKKRNV